MTVPKLILVLLRSLGEIGGPDHSGEALLLSALGDKISSLTW